MKGAKSSHIHGIVKPNAWKTTDVIMGDEQRAENLKLNASMGMSAENDDELTMSMSIAEFLKTIPAFHKATNDDLDFLEENCYNRRYEAGLHDDQIICDSDDGEDIFIVRNGVIDQCTPNVLNEHGEVASLFPLTRGAIFPAEQHDDGYVVYKPVGICRFDMYKYWHFREKENINDLLRDLISISIGKSIEEVTLNKHIEHFVTFRELLMGKKRDEFDRRFDVLKGKK